MDQGKKKDSRNCAEFVVIEVMVKGCNAIMLKTNFQKKNILDTMYSGRNDYKMNDLE